MRKIFVQIARVALVAVAAGTVLAACAGDVDEVDRVQPGYVTKADLLDSSWYYRRTVVDSPETMGPYATIGTGDLFTIERIVWDIQEDYLIAYRDYEFTPGAEESEFEGNNDYRGSPVASFPIKSHFDVIFQYNPATGEKTNVRVEDTSERYWNERQYIRVDWSKNLNPNLDFIIPVDFFDLNGVGGGNLYVHEDDANNPWRARIEPDKGYLDFVVDHYVVPDVYTCWSYYDFNIWDAFNCGAGEIRVRHAFMKVNDVEEAGYEPLYYPDSVTLEDAQGNDMADTLNGGVIREPVFERFGYYRLDRLTFDNIRGLTESGRLYRIIRFNIWQQSIDANGDTIPYAQRIPKPIIYYTNWDFPKDLVGAAAEVANEWDDVFRGTVASLQNKSLVDVRKMFELRENSCNTAGLLTYLDSHTDVRSKVRESIGASMPTDELLDNWCSATEYFSQGLEDRFTWEQIGDPRFNMMYWITNIVPSGFAGYGPMLADPISGRNVTSTAYIMGWTIEGAATRALEYIDYINGELTLDDLLLGSDAPNVFDNNFDSRAATFSIDSVFERANAMVPQSHLDNLASRMQDMGGNPQARMTPMENSGHFAERLARVRGTDLERNYLLRNEDLMLASRGEWLPGMPIEEELWDQASFVNRIRDIQARRDRTNKLMQERTMCPMADLDGALVGLAKKLKDLGLCAAVGQLGYNEMCVPAGGCAAQQLASGGAHPEYDANCQEFSDVEKAQMRRQLRRQSLKESIFKAVMLHEVGHNVGLRHNFEGSYDALNYDKQFWDLETTGLSMQDKLDAQQPEFMYSSIMDYHGKTNGDFQGLGRYDNAAIKFGYGQILEEFNDAGIAGNSTLRQWMWEHDYRELIHPSNVDGHEDNHAPYFADSSLANSVNKIYDRSDMIWDWRVDRNYNDVRALLQKEVPYMFCSDEYANYTPTCKRFDFGANQREVQASSYVKYKNYFLFTNFLRYKLVLDWDRVLSRSYSVFKDTNLTYQYMYLYSAKDDNFQAGTDLGADMATAVAGGLNLMSETLALPRPSRYYRCSMDPAQPDQDVTYYTGGYIRRDPVGSVIGLAADPTQEVFGPEWGIGLEGELCHMNTEMDLELGAGFPLFFGFSEDYVSWTFTYLGTYWDKQYALLELTDPLAIFFRENQVEDMRTYSISLYRLYPDEVNDVLLSLIEYDRKGLASFYDEGTGALVPKAMVDFTPGGNGAGMPKVVPSLARNLQLYALLFGMAYLTSPLDETLDFAKHTRVAVKGSPEDFSAFEEANSVVAECRLPESGRTYRALQTASEGSRIDIGYNFVNRCARELVVERAALVDWETATADLDAWELANNGADRQNPAWLALDIELDKKWVEWERRDFELRQTEQTLVYMRELNKYYEYGVGF